MKITIVLPHYYSAPIGGYHVLYNYANLLQARGHQVCVLFPRDLSLSSSWHRRMRTPLWVLKTRIQNRPLTPFFKFQEGVQLKFVSDLSGLPKADALIATAWQTAELLQHAPASRGQKFYLVQDYEHWRTAEPAVRERIERTFKTDFLIISISAAVDWMLQQCGAVSRIRIPCGIDFTAFGRDVAAAHRPPFSVGFPARSEPFKGTADAISAVTMLRDIYGDRLEVTAFGSDTIDMPSWIRRLHWPNQSTLREFYNKISVFMVPSHFEGFGLPACEAMACGAALVTTDTGGSQDYAIADDTALVVPPKQPQLLAAAVNHLFQDAALRNEIAERGHAFIQRFRWDQSVDSLERVLQGRTVPRSVPEFELGYQP
jgi:glycosyltransferase involved in cell wall biosynthesis